MRYNYSFFENLPEKLYPAYTAKFYNEIMNEFILGKDKKIDLKKPKTLTQKIQWLKLYDSTPLKTYCADKLTVIDYVREKVPELKFAKIYSSASCFEDLDFSHCPEKFVIKTNHACKQMIKVESKTDLFSTEQGQKDLLEYKRIINEYLSKHFAFDYVFELHYKDIPRKVFLQEYIESNDSQEGYLEYKVNCFNGKAVYMEYYRNNECFVCDRNRKQLDFTYFPFAKMTNFVFPENFDKMIRFAEILSKDFKLVRVDFFEYNKELYLSELTFTPYSGFMKFSPLEYDLKIGKLLKL